MSVAGVIAFVFGVLGVWLTIKQNILCWPAALVSVIASAIDFYTTRLFGDMALQAFYFAAGVYGWIYWEQNRNKPFEVRKMPKKWMLPMIFITGFQFLAYYFLLKYFKGARPLLDGLLTAASLTITYMMTKKWVENWILWVIVDGIYILLYALTGLWSYSLLYLLFTVIAFYGWLKWKKVAY